MSLNNSTSSDYDNFLNDENECRFCVERQKTSVTVDSMIKWISALEDKIGQSMKLIDDKLDLLVEDRQTLINKNTELVRCNRELAERVSESLFKKEFKLRKVTDPAAEQAVKGSLHPKVIPYVYLDKSKRS